MALGEAQEVRVLLAFALGLLIGGERERRRADSRYVGRRHEGGARRSFAARRGRDREQRRRPSRGRGGAPSAIERVYRDHADAASMRSDLGRLAATALEFALDLNAYPEDPCDGATLAHRVRGFVRTLVALDGLKAPQNLVKKLRALLPVAGGDAVRSTGAPN